MNERACAFGIGCILIVAQLSGDRIAAADSSAQSGPRWIDIGSDKVVIARDSMSADGRNALAWTVDSSEPVDWSLLEKDPNHFYEQYDVKEIWIVNIPDKKKVGSVEIGRASCRERV